MFQKFRIVWMIGILLTSALVAASSSNLMAAASGATTPKSEDSSSDVTKVPVDPFAALVHITNGKGAGSGVFFTPTHVLTAKHVVHQLRESTIALLIDSQGEVYKMNKVWEDHRTDAAVIEVDRATKVVPAKVSCKEVSMLQPLFAAGFPLNLNRVLTPLVVVGTDITPTPMGVVRILATGSVVSGMSGGPVYNADGEVVATVSLEHIDNEAAIDSDINGLTSVLDVKGLCVPVEPKVP